MSSRTFRPAGFWGGGALGFSVPSFALLVISSAVRMFSVVLKSEPLMTAEFEYPEEVSGVGEHCQKAQILEFLCSVLLQSVNSATLLLCSLPSIKKKKK